MNNQQFDIMKRGKGFVAALDQSGGSTPKALAAYGISSEAYESEEKMYELVHDMRTRIIKSPSFEKDKILGAILFERTMDSLIDGKHTADFLWEEKGIVPFLKIDKGLAELNGGVQMMKPIPGLDDLLNRAVERNIFGTKMRSVIKELNPRGIDAIVEQQFEWGRKIAEKGLVPILEPEVDIHSGKKEEIEAYLLKAILQKLENTGNEGPFIFKLTIPTKDDLYLPLIGHPRVVRVVALSGGYSREDADDRLSRNHGLIASFSRALSEGLAVGQSDKEFDAVLGSSIRAIYSASIT